MEGVQEYDRITRPVELSECTSLEREWNLRRKTPAKKQGVTEVEQNSDGLSVKWGDAKEADTSTEYNSVRKFKMAMTKME